MEQNIVSHIEGFEILEKIGDGPNGEVFKAWDPIQKRTVALKWLNEKLSSDPAFRGPALTSIKSISLIDSPILTTVSEIKEVGNRILFIEEYFDGIPINEYFKDRIITNDELLYYLNKIIKGLQFIHETTTAHGNLKPSNILINHIGEVRLLDNGFPHNFDIEKIDYNNIADDEFQYLAPEIIHGEVASRSSDLYALGVIFYEIICQKLPFDAEENKELLKKITHNEPDLSLIHDKKFPGDTLLCLKKFLKKNPADRFSDATEMLVTLKEMEKFNHQLPQADDAIKSRFSQRSYLLITLVTLVAIVFWVIIASFLNK